MNSERKQTLFQTLCKEWNNCHSDLKGDRNQQDAIQYWNVNKNDASAINIKITELKALKLKRQGSVLNFFCKAANNAVRPSEPQPKPATLPNLEFPRQEDGIPEPVAEDSSLELNVRTPVQDETKKILEGLNTKIDILQAAKNSGLATESQIVELKASIELKEKTKKKLSRLQNEAERKRRSREVRKRKLEELKTNDPATFDMLKNVLPTREASAGRPRLETQQPALLETIIKLVSPVSSAHERRRMETLRACMTLDSLHNALLQEGYQLSRSALYLRLLPRNYTTTEGKHHVVTVPVKLIRAKNDLRKRHMDTHFCASTIGFLKDLAEFMGEKTCFVLSQDNKATVPLGLSAANKQAPILMRMDYRVILPDHDYVVASKHKLVPSVYAGITFDSHSRKLTYSGPTYIAIRSAKHDKSTAETHAIDFRRILEVDIFKTLALTSAGETKPIIFIFTDGGPDENPRFRKVMIENSRHFRNHNLDALFVATHAPGQSAHNQVERRMAPISRDLSGVILPYEHFGSHLDSNGKTINAELERRNFKKAAECLAEIWNGKIIDNFKVFAESRILKENNQDDAEWIPSEKWFEQHVRQSQYLLQIVKCKDTHCCTPPRTNIFKTILQERFLPAPVLINESEEGPSICEFSDIEGHFGSLQNRLFLKRIEPTYMDYTKIPFDLYCPSLSSELSGQICPCCHLYFAAKSAMESHKKACHCSSMKSIIDTIESVANCITQTAAETSDADDPFPVVKDFHQWLHSSPFEEIE